MVMMFQLENLIGLTCCFCVCIYISSYLIINLVWSGRFRFFLSMLEIIDGFIIPYYYVAQVKLEYKTNSLFPQIEFDI